MYIETSAPRLTGEVARIYSPFISSSYPAECLVFHYHMFGEHVAQLKVLIETIDGHVEYIWKSLGNHGDVWQKAVVHLPSVQTDFQVAFNKEIVIHKDTLIDLELLLIGRCFTRANIINILQTRKYVKPPSLITISLIY